MNKENLLQFIELKEREGTIELDLSGEQLSTLPPEIGKLTQLKKLILGKYQYDEKGNRIGTIGNNLRVLPVEIGLLNHLEELQIVANQLSSLPSEIVQMPKLKKLDLRGNPVPIPPEILGPKTLYQDPGNVKEILDFYFRVQDPSETEPFYEAKFLIVGEGGSGKTFLAKKIADESLLAGVRGSCMFRTLLEGDALRQATKSVYNSPMTADKSLL